MGLMKKLGVEVSEEDRILEFDKDKDGTIDFNEFLILMKDVVTDVHDDTRLHEAFTMFDKDNNGFIDINELGDIMQKLGQNLNLNHLLEMIESADMNKDGKISFEEFKKLMISPL